MTVYRIGDDTPFVKSLIRAAEAGKQVACVIEIKARFDEERNLHWAAELEKAGAHVTFGVRGLKNAREDDPRRSQRAGGAAQLCPYWNRELPRADGQALHGRRFVHLRPRAGPGRSEPLSLFDRALPSSRLCRSVGRTYHDAAALPPTCEGRNREPPRRATGPHRGQDE